MRLARLLLAASSLAGVHANTNAQSTIFVCATPQQSDLTQSGFEGLTWVPVGAIGNLGETGSKTNILTYDTWNTTVTQKAKGITDAGSPTLECARIPSDPGQIILRNAAKTNFNYAIKVVRNDAQTIGGTPTIIYNRGLITGPTRPNGKNEDFDLEVFTLALNQIEIVVDPNPSSGSGNPPMETVAPAITGTAQVGQVLTSSSGTFTGDATITYTYQWKRAGVAISGANSNTYTVVSADVGRVLTSRVTATNGSGSAVAESAPTSAAIA